MAVMCCAVVCMAMRGRCRALPGVAGIRKISQVKESGGSFVVHLVITPANMPKPSSGSTYVVLHPMPEPS
jgi:hypothetical protein